MSRDVPDIVVFALVVAVAISAVAVPVSALDGSTTAATVAGGERVAQQTADGASGTNESASNESNDSVAPGQRLAGVVGVQGAELDGEIEDRELEQRVASADSNDSKAAVVATELNTARERLQTLRERRDQLREARQSGEMSPGEYRARMAVTAAQVQSLQRQLNTSERVSRDLPDAALEARGVNRTEIDQLQRNTDELTGPEIAEIARDIAGNGSGPGPAGRADSARGNAGNGAGTGPPDEADERAGEPPEDPGAGRDNASNATRMPNTPTNQSSNRSTTGSPDEAGQPEGAGSGNSEGAGESESSDDTGNASDSGNANDESESSDSESDGTGDSGNSNSAGNSGESGDSANAGESGDSGSSDESGDPGNSDNAGGGRP
ncbi:DUF7096 domain-containing protein [Haloplanus sp. C73]|uniref:DUF7096 domain-containing protein n=1 Tax=Haloplanus sp. C73 TaxID=3421641 RepID=UPI003EB76294